MTLTASGATCKFKWSGPGIVGLIDGATLQVTAGTQAATYTAHFYDPLDYEVATATALIEVAQPDLTYIITRTARTPVTDPADLATAPPDVGSTTTTFFNGFGQAVQTVAQRESPGGNDIVSATEFDRFGRPERQLLPYTTPHAGRTGYSAYRNDYTADQLAFYQAFGDRVANDPAPWSRSWFEPGPTGRPLIQAGPGAAWQPNASGVGGHPVRQAYGTNATQQVRRFVYDFGLGKVIIASPAYYPAGTLALTQTTDENGHPHRVFTDSEGHEVLRQTPLDSLHQTWASTYTVFDDLGNKRLILPPMAVEAIDASGALTAQTIGRWAYTYAYDERGRLIEKHLPGDVPSYLVYNQRNQPVATGDALGNWFFTKYDALGRPVMTGLYTAAHGLSRATLQAAADAAPTRFEQPVGRAPSTGDTVGQGSLDYTITRAWPTNIALTDLLTRTYYDRDDWAAIRAAGHRFAGEDVAARDLDAADADHPPFRLTRAALSTRTLGLVTTTQERVLGQTGAWLSTSTYYDERFRPAQTLTDLPAPDGTVGGHERSSYARRWDGPVEQELTRHAFTGADQPIDLTRYLYLRYDAAGRLRTTQLKLAETDFEQTPLLLASSNQYNERGEIVDTRLHSLDGGQRWVQSVDYRYHLRGWLTHCNDRHLLRAGQLDTYPPPAGFDPPTDDPRRDGPDLFGMELYYERPGPLAAGPVPTPRQWGGNLTEQHWRTHNPGTDGRQRAFAYRYDPAGRLLAAPSRTFRDPFTDGAGKYGAWAPPGFAPDPFAPPLPDYSVARLRYDANGNLLRLRRSGAAPGGSLPGGPNGGALLDDLTLAYDGNRLIAVTDAAGPTTAATHDFEDDGLVFDPHSSAKAPPRTYDARGSLVHDSTQHQRFRYNVLGLTERITVGVSPAPARTLTSTYTAAGRKVCQSVQDPYSAANTPARTLFVGGMGVVYEDHADGRGLLPAWVPTPTGRLVRRPPFPDSNPYATWADEYHLRDHLGNLRLAFQPTVTRANWEESFEDEPAQPRAAAAADSLAPGSAPPRPAGPAGLRVQGVAAARRRQPLRARTGRHLLYLAAPAPRSSTAARPVAPSVSLPIGAGDSVFAHVWASYDLPLRPAHRPLRLRTAAAVPAVTAADALPKTRRFPALGLTFAAALPALFPAPVAARTAPNAYLLLQLYASDSTLLAEQRVFLTDSVPAGEWQPLAAKAAATQDGYIVVSLHNDSPQPAYFDDLALRLVGKEMQENHYDPWGLNLVGAESPGTPTHRFQFNGKEQIDALDLHLNDHGARTLSLHYPTWGQLDPLAELYPQESPYAFGHNNPLRFTDPDGRVAIDGNLEVTEEKTRNAAQTTTRSSNIVRVFTETKGVGHSFVAVGTGKNTVVYTYGRYDGVYKHKPSSNSTSPKGPGVLVKLSGTEASNYISMILNEREGKEFTIDAADGKKVTSFYERLLSSTNKTPNSGLYSNDNQLANSLVKARVIDTYNVLYRNCTTMVLNAIGETIPGFGQYTDYLPTGDAFIPMGQTYQSSVVAPSGLENYLINSRCASRKQ